MPASSISNFAILDRRRRRRRRSENYIHIIYIHIYIKHVYILKNKGSRSIITLIEWRKKFEKREREIESMREEKERDRKSLRAMDKKNGFSNGKSQGNMYEYSPRGLYL